MRTFLGSIASLIVASSAVAQCEPVQLLQNGSFEFPVIANNSAQANVTPTGWTWTPVVGGFLFRGAVGSIWPLAVQGSQYLDIGNAGNYALRQVITVPHRQVVRMDWRASAATGAGTSPYTVRVRHASDLSTIFQYSTDAAGPYPLGEFWRGEAISLGVEAGQYVVEFEADGVATGFDTLIDDVSVRALAEPYVLSGLAYTFPLPGESVSLTARVWGVGPFTYQWEMRAGGVGGTWTPLSDSFVPGVGFVAGTNTDTLTWSDVVAGVARDFRCIVSNPCGTSPTGLIFPVVVPQCDSIDFNRNNVYPEDQDVIDFFSVLAGADCPACRDIDFNNNGVFPEDQDVIDFFNVLAGGICG
jgi:hypothetical protein